MYSYTAAPDMRQGMGGGRLQEKGASDNQAEQLDVWLLRVVQFAAI